MTTNVLETLKRWRWIGRNATWIVLFLIGAYMIIVSILVRSSLFAGGAPVVFWFSVLFGAFSIAAGAVEFANRKKQRKALSWILALMVLATVAIIIGKFSLFSHLAMNLTR
jgi:uncharacterized membrane protein YhaH (DUF805 family)